MKKHRWFAALAVIVMTLAVAGCSDGSSGNEFASGSSGTGNSGVNIPVVFVKGGTVTGKSNTNIYPSVL